MHHIFFPPRLEVRLKEYMAYPLVRDRAKLLVRFQKLFSQGHERPVVVSFGRIGAGGGDDECGMFRRDFPWLARAGASLTAAAADPRFLYR